MTDSDAARVLKAYSDSLKGRGPFRFDTGSRTVPLDFRDAYSMRDLHEALDYAITRLSSDGRCITDNPTRAAAPRATPNKEGNT